MARKGSGGVKFYYDSLTPNLRLFALRFEGYMVVEMRKWAAIIEEYAQSHAPWKNRTGDARRGLRGEGHARGFYHYIDLSHTVDYGLWLEVRWNGKYAIIEPTIRRLGPAVMADLSIRGGISGPAAAIA
jgi:hypothetical protein